MQSFELLLIILATVGNIFLGLFTLSKNYKSITNKLFFFFSLAIALYIPINFLALHQNSDIQTLFWIRVVMAVALFINVLFFLLVYAFPKAVLNIKFPLLLVILIFTFLLVPITQTNLIFESVKPNTTQPIPGLGMPLFLLHTIIFIGGGLFILLRKAIKFSGIERSQTKFFLLGAILMFLAIITTNLLFVIFLGTTAFVNLLPLYTLVFVGSISYAIVRHRFLDINLLVARSVAFSLLVIVISIIYTITIFGVGSIFFGGSESLSRLSFYIATALLTAFSFNPLKNLLQKITNKILFKNQYSSNELLSRLTKIMASTLRLEELTRKTLHDLVETMHINSGAFITFSDLSMYPPVTEGYSFGQEPLFNKTTIENLCNFKRMIIYDEEENLEIKNMLREHNISVALPLFVGDTLHGALILGGKKSGDVYSDQDIEVLRIFGPEVSVAIQNSKAYEEIKRFNITLKEEIEKATRDLKMANTKLEELDKLKDDFVSIASHELRTPMTAIRSYAWMALNRSDVPLSEKLRRYLGRSLISTERLINLVNDMLNISRIESGRIEITPQVFDLTTLIRDVLEEVSQRAKERNLHVLLLGGAIPKVFADPDKVHQVLLNLIGNALKFTPTNGQITISFSSDGQVVEATIKDSGVGITADDLPRLFKKFGRLDYSYVAAATSGGTGLGLFISKSLIELMRGKIWVNSEGLGKGAAFSFTLPVATPTVLSQAEKYTQRSEGQVKYLEPVAI